MTRLIRTLLTLAAALLLTGADDIRILYKYLDADGRTVYSDKAPPRGVKFDTIQVDTSKSVASPPPRGDAGKSTTVDEFEARWRELKAREAEHERLIADLQQVYDAAVAAMEAGQDPREGERNQNVNGMSRLNETYFNRIAELQQKIDDARAKLEAAKRQ